MYCTLYLYALGVFIKEYNKKNASVSKLVIVSCNTVHVQYSTYLLLYSYI